MILSTYSCSTALPANLYNTATMINLTGHLSVSVLAFLEKKQLFLQRGDILNVNFCCSVLQNRMNWRQRGWDLVYLCEIQHWHDKHKKIIHPLRLHRKKSIWSSAHVDINYINSSLSGIICLCVPCFQNLSWCGMQRCKNIPLYTADVPCIWQRCKN